MSPPQGATWRNGYAPLCKSVYPGSIPGVASIHLFFILHLFRKGGLLPGIRDGSPYPLANLG